MTYPPEEVENIVEALFIEADEELCEELIETIALKPNPMRDYYLRQIFLHFPDFRLRIIKQLNLHHVEYAKTFLLDALEQWTVYIDPLPEDIFKALLLEFINGTSVYASDPQVKQALKKFRSEWKTEGIVKQSFSLFSTKKDSILEAIQEVLNK